MMQERSKQIFGNNIASGAYRKAVRSKQKFIRKFGDDSTKNYPTSIKANPYIGPELGVSDIRVGEEGSSGFSYGERNHCWKYPYGIWPLPHFYGNRFRGACVGL